MKRYILQIMLFFSIVTVVDLGFGYVCEWLHEHAKGGRMKIVRQAALEQTADIVIMGSSRAHHHYVPPVISEETGLSVYNAGIDGNGIVLATGLYEMMKVRYTPKVIIYDVEPAFDINVYAEDGNNTRYIGELRPYSWKPQVKRVICSVDPSERYKTMSAMFRYNGKIADLLKDQFVVSEYTLDGYAPLFGEMKTIHKMKSTKNAVEHDSLKLGMMENFISRLSKSETRLIVVASPKYGATSSKAFTPIKEMCKRHNVEFWDFYNTPDFQKMEYFKESMHLNDKGARIFSTIVGLDI